MKIRTAIIDDEKDARELVKHHLAKIEDITVIGEAANGRDAIVLIEEKKPDLVLLDIEMPELNGLEGVHNLQYLPQIIFVTAFDEYAVEAFEIHAIDYLLKPFNASRLTTAIQRVKDLLLNKSKDKEQYLNLLDSLLNRQEQPYISRIAVKSSGKTTFVNVQDVVSIEAADQYVVVHTINNKHLLRQSMDYFEKALDPNHFIRTHRSNLIQINCVQSVEQYEPKNLIIHLKGGLTARLSQSRKILFDSKLKIG